MKTSCIDLSKRDCCLCGRSFQPNSKNPPGSLIYCSARCAYSPDTGRDMNSIKREYDALKAALNQDSQKNKCEP